MRSVHPRIGFLEQPLGVSTAGPVPTNKRLQSPANARMSLPPFFVFLERPMPNEAYLSTWKTYQSAWSDVGDAERKRLLQASVSENCIYADPITDERHGHAELIEKIRNSQASYPGVSFRNDQLTDYGDQGLSEWTMYGANGAELLRGASYARFGEDGRLTRMSGFFKPPGPVGAESAPAPTAASITWDTYQAAWARISLAQRRTLLTRSVDQAGIYSDPAGVCAGRDKLIAYVDGFQEKFSGDWFRQTLFIEYDGQAFSRWERVPADGSVPTPGASYARFQADGRLIQMSGFPGSALRQN